MSKHTPGPWKVCRGANGWFVIAPSEAGAYSDATIAEFRDVSHGAMHAHRAEADARLFAAAPDLLAACQEFVAKCDRGEAKSKRSYAQMKAAIAAATGEAA